MGYQPYITVVTETQGTKEDLPCSGRGICDVETSICTCTFGYTISNGFGALPAVGDRNMANCGYSDPTLVKFDCPGEIGCSGHGMCSGAPTYHCACSIGWMGSDCSERTCNFHSGWVSEPSADGVSHQELECSGAGGCYRSKGFCQCSNGFEGSACERLMCPGTPQCSGHGACRTQQLLAESVSERGALTIAGLWSADKLDYTYGRKAKNRHTWDHSMIQGCECDPGFSGIDCSLRECPRGEDPKIPGGTHEVQAIVCEATVGLFSLKFRGHETASLDYRTSSADLKIALEALPSIGKVKVRNLRTERLRIRLNSDEYNATLVDKAGNVVGGIDEDGDGIAEYTYDHLLPCRTCDAMHKCVTQTPCVRLDTVCSFTGDNEVHVTFLTDLGNLPPMAPVLKRYASSVIRVEINDDGIGGSVKGTKGNFECSNRGLCNRETAQCTCFAGYSSGDGSYGPGNRGDCGYQHPEVDGHLIFHHAGPGG